VTNGYTYYYTVCAVTSVGDGDQATETSATPPTGNILAIYPPGTLKTPFANHA